MLTFAYYILKVIICSGILYGYYLIALRNKIFHRWNRFYLLAIVVISFAAPLIKINILQNEDGSSTQAIHILQAVNSGDEFVYEYTKNTGSFQINASNLSLFLYTIISGLLLAFLIQTLIRINKLKTTYQSTLIGEINFINTDAKGTPFSFFNNIFWNNNIDINTLTGKQIFHHEVAHVQEKHSYDKIFMNIVLIFFWCNPIFWLIRKELNMIHEFIADKIAVEDNDTSDFAAMILQATYPQQQFNITNNFFYSPLKRRLAMLTKNKNPRVNYITRILVLPIAALVFLAFALKMKTYNPGSVYKGRTINVIIDAGHGGDDNGAMVDNIKEKDLTLAIAKEIKELNKNENINIILSREKDQRMDVRDRVKFAGINKADLYISIHIDVARDTMKYRGLHIYIPKNDYPYLTQSRVLGSSIIESFKNNYTLPVANDFMQRDKGIYVLNENQSPAILIEAGLLTSQRDLDFLTDPKNQKTIAKNILNGIEKYAQQLSAPGNEIKYDYKQTDDSIPQYYKGKKIKQAYGSNKLHKAVILYEDGTSDSIQIKEAEKLRIIPPPPPPPPSSMILREHQDSPLIVVDGVVKGYDKKDLSSISSNSIESISVLKGEEARKKYGDEGKDGVIEIVTKQKDNIVSDIDKVFTKVESEPSFPGGYDGWIRYMKKIIEKNIDALLTENKQGTCRIRFIVNTDSTVSNITVLTMQGTKLAQIAVEAIKNGPKWNPAIQNGRVVAAYREQPITFVMADQSKVANDDDKVFTKMEVEPSFPGGSGAWAVYIKKIIEKYIAELTQAGNSGTCRIRFIVAKDGTVSNVEALTMKGTKLAEVAINAIRKGPKWNPGQQNGHIVNAYKEVPVTFTIDGAITFIEKNP